MQRLFQDHDGHVLLHRDAREVRVNRGEFINKFPEYQLPHGVVTRRWDGEFHHIFNEVGDQSLGDDITDEQFELYLDAIPYLKEPLLLASDL